MATASGKAEDAGRRLMPYVAYGVVLALLAVTAFAAWTGRLADLPDLGGGRAPIPTPAATSIDPARTARSLKLPPRPAAPEAATPDAAAATKQEPAPSPSADAAEKKPEPPRAECKVDFNRWPLDRTDQAQAVQVLLRHLGYYRGTTNGTVGPQTRTAIREFQLAAGEAETGEVTEALFEALKKKCASSAN